MRATEDEYYLGFEDAAVSEILVLVFAGVLVDCFIGFYLLEGSAVLLILLDELLDFGSATTLLSPICFYSL